MSSNLKYLKVLLDHNQLNITLQRLAHQLVENHLNFGNTVLIGIQPRGVFLSKRIAQLVEKIIGKQVNHGILDITFYRDDIHQGTGLHVPSQTDVPGGVDGKNVVLIDDVLHTGRTIRSAMDALIDFGRPKNVELLVLVDRRFSREFPIQPDYVGYTVDTIVTQKVKVCFKENDAKDEVILLD